MDDDGPHTGTTGTRIIKSPYGSPETPFVPAGDRLIGIDAGTTIYALDVFTGEVVTAERGYPYAIAAGPDDLSEPPLTVAGGRILFMENGALQARRVSDGTAVASLTAPHLDGVQSLVAAGDVVLTLMSDRGETKMAAYRVTDGSRAWPPPEASPIAASQFTSGIPALGVDAIYYVAQNRLFATNTRFGETRFPKQPRQAPGVPPGRTAPPVLAQTRPPLLAKGTIVCAGDAVYGFDGVKGILKWVWAGQNQGASKWWIAAAADAAWIVAVNAADEIAILDPDTGAVIAGNRLDSGAAGQPAVVRNEIYVIADGNQSMTTLSVDVARGQVTRRDHVPLDRGVSSVGPAVANATLFLPLTNGDLRMQPFGLVEAAFFDGATFVDAGPVALGAADFTLEAWVRSSSGGEIVSATPVGGGAQLRFNLSGDGELRLAMVGANEADIDAFSTGTTNTADGYWHHVAATREAGKVALWLDGSAQHIFSQQKRAGVVQSMQGVAVDAHGIAKLGQLSPAPLPDPLAIGSPAHVAIGASPVPATPAERVFWRGLLREVRLWDAAADAATVQSRMNSSVSPDHAHLVGNWHLDERLDAGEEIRNDLLTEKASAKFAGGHSVPTDLDLQDCFPFLLHQKTLQWPYAPRWSARGNGDVAGSPALSDDGVLCFHSRDGVYAVDKATGTRLWSIPIDVTCSAPTAYGQAFYVLWARDGLVKIDSQTGHWTSVPAFAEMPKPDPAATFLPAPVHDGRFLAAALPDGTLWLQDLQTTPNPALEQLHVSADPQRLLLDGDRLYCASSGPGGTTLHVVSPGSGAAPLALQVDTPIFHAHAARVFCTRGGQLTAFDPAKRDDETGWTTPLLRSAAITGLDADSDSNLCVVTTNTGDVYGLGFATLGLRWQTAVPQGEAASPHAKARWLNPPAVNGRNVFVTSHCGTVAALDVRNGAFRGLFREENAILFDPLEDGSSIFFACDTGPEGTALDGAVHSVVFGESYALRLGLDPAGASETPGYACILKDQAVDALHFRDPTQCSVEGWINTGEAGDILSVCPSSASRLGLRLQVEAPGALHFTLQIQGGDGTWQQIEAAATVPGLCDRAWHHLCIAVKSLSDVRVYVDGRRHDRTLTRDAANPSSVVAGSLICIGADATAGSPPPVGSFRGLIADVRLWDTSVTAHDVTMRMHDRLRGDEPDLVAYWPFDSVGITDAARNGFDGVLQPENTAATFWLTDLAFQHPNYPDLVTEAVIKQSGEPDLPPGDPKSTTVYSLKLTARDGAGTPQKHHALRLWYVKHEELADPDTVGVFYNDVHYTLTDVAPHATEDNPAEKGATSVWLDLLTDESGTATLEIATLELSHGPSFDLWADFLPRHERYHVNVLLRDQELAKPAPPYLTAQAKLIQDYHWSAGSDIDETRSRPTYQVVIRCFEPDHTPRADERLRLYATGSLQIEVKGKQYEINEHNSQLFDANMRGELTVILAADSLQPPSLSILAGFMGPNTRYVVDPAEDAHSGLAQVEGDHLKDPDRLQNWRKPDASGKDQSQRGPLLNDDYQPHAEKIAATMRHVMSAAHAPPAMQTVPPPAMAIRTHAVAPLPPHKFRDMAQPFRMPLGDAVRALPTMRHVHRRATATPESMAHSLQSASPGAAGFSIRFGKSAGELTFTYFTAGEADAHMGRPHVRGRRIQPMSFFGSIWDGIKSVAETIAEKVESIAVSVGDAITVAIHAIDSTVHIVVDTVEQAVSIVVDFIKKIALEIWMIILFLLMLFDWSAILAAHQIAKQVIKNAAARLAHDLGDAKAIREKMEALKSLTGLAAHSRNPGDSPLSLIDLSGTTSNVLASATGVGANAMRTKAEEHAADITVNNPTPAADMEAFGKTLVTDLAQGVIDLAQQLPHLNLSDAGDAILALLEKVAADALDGVITMVADTLAAMANIASKQLDQLDTEIDVPLISTLYKWITGDELSFLDLICLALGLALHVTSVVVVQKAFRDIADGIADAIAPPARPRTALAAASFAVLPQDPLPWAAPGLAGARGAEIAYAVLESVHVLARLGTDALFFVESARRYPDKTRSFFKILRGLTGYTSAVIQFVWSNPLYARRVAEAYNLAGKEPAETIPGLSWQTYLEITELTKLVSAVLGNTLTLAGGIKGQQFSRYDFQVFQEDGIELRTLGGSGAEGDGEEPGEIPGMPWSRTQPGTFDVVEFWVLLGVAFMMLGHDIVKIYRRFTGDEFSTEVAHGELAEASELLVAKDIVGSIGSLTGFLWNGKFASTKYSAVELYALMAGLRVTSGFASVALHTTAMFKDLHPPD